MERKILLFSAAAPSNLIRYPKKRVWLSVEIPGDEELWPEIFAGDSVSVVEMKIEDQNETKQVKLPNLNDNPVNEEESW